jgi:hypothetical protein
MSRNDATKKVRFGGIVGEDCNGPTDDVVKLRRDAKRLEKTQFPHRPNTRNKGLSRSQGRFLRGENNTD